MRLLAHGLILGLFSLGCSNGSSALGYSGAGPGGYGGAVGTTGSWTGSGGGGGGLSLSSGATSGTTTSTTTGSATVGAASSSSSSSSSSGSDAGSGTGGSGDCQTSADCPEGQSCVAVTPGGFDVCQVTPKPVTTCTSSLNQCCPSSMPCPDGAPCYLGPLVPVCAGVVMQPHNQCAVDQCSKDADCAADRICALAGTLGLEIRACVAAYCMLDTDCAAHPGGTCAPAQDPCCSASAGLFCVYPGNGGCRSDADCPAISGHPSRYCWPDATSGIASCQDGGPVCPA